MLRFAPSPTGDMHTGNLRAAIFNYILAKQRGEKFLLRIEDTDSVRNIEGKDRDIMFLLQLFSLNWDELVYQSNNFPRHRAFAEQLIKSGAAFYCYCSREFLDKKREEFTAQKKAFRYDDAWAELEKNTNKKPVIRLKGAKDKMSFKDKIKGQINFEPNEIDSFVIIKDDGVPTYNFACACDDMLYDISFVVRGEDHVSNTPRQMLIHRALGYNQKVDFAHLPIILNEEGKKMSKRDNASSVQWLLDSGFLPSAIVNYLILLGNKTPCEVFSLQEAISWFDITKISHSPAKFDLDKLRFLNREHFKRMNSQDLAALLDFKDPKMGDLAKIYLQEASSLNELRTKLWQIFSKRDLNAAGLGEFEAQYQKIVNFLAGILEKSGDFSSTSYDELKAQITQNTELKGKALFKPLRFILSGAEHGPEIADLWVILRHFMREILHFC